MHEARPTLGVQESLLDLLWSLWTELGVPGPHRRHPQVVVDPEPLVVATPALAESDPRLLDLVFSWCTRHADRISVSRLTALLRAASPGLRAPATAFLGELASTGVWRAAPPCPPSRPREHREIALPTERPALLRFRVRALAGVGGRADVLVSLLAVPDAWRDAASFDEVGIAKRNVARVLGELADGGLVEARVRGNAREFRLRAPDALAALVDRPRHAVFPPWMVLFEGMSTALGLGALPADRPSSRRVAIARSRAGIDELAVSLGAARPTGDPEAVLARVERLLRSLAEDEPVADPATIGEAIDQQARLSTVGAGLRLRGSAFDPRGPWIVTRSGTAEVVGAGRTPHEAVDAALAALAR